MGTCAAGLGATVGEGAADHVGHTSSGIGRHGEGRGPFKPAARVPNPVGALVFRWSEPSGLAFRTGSKGLPHGAAPAGPSRRKSSTTRGGPTSKPGAPRRTSSDRIRGLAARSEESSALRWSVDPAGSSSAGRQRRHPAPSRSGKHRDLQDVTGPGRSLGPDPSPPRQLLRRRVHRRRLGAHTRRLARGRHGSGHPTRSRGRRRTLPRG